MLRKRDAQQNKICFVDISSDSFRPEDNNNISYEQVRCACTTCLLAAQILPWHSDDVHHASASISSCTCWKLCLQDLAARCCAMQAMGTIHGVLPDGRVITNVEVFRKLYEAVGLGWVYAPTQLGPIGKAADA